MNDADQKRGIRELAEVSLKIAHLARRLDDRRAVDQAVDAHCQLLKRWQNLPSNVVKKQKMLVVLTDSLEGKIDTQTASKLINELKHD